MKTGSSIPAVLNLGKLAPQPWMTAPETKTIWAALTAKGAQVRFIGGCVRDTLLRRPIRDIDIATPDPPEKVQELLEGAGIRVIPTGIDHGTVTAIINRRSFEITTLRIDLETDGRRAKVAFTDDWSADAMRRDFTINTFSCNMEGDIFDPFNSLNDLACGEIKFVGVPKERIQEDILRLLRFFRFFATYGRPPANAEALAACRAEAHNLPILSGERVRVEIYRILMSKDPAGVITLMQAHDVLEHVLPEAGNVERLRALSQLDANSTYTESVKPHPVTRLAALLETNSVGAKAVASRLRMSNRRRRRLVALACPQQRIVPDMSSPALRRALHGYGSKIICDLALQSWAHERSVDPRQPQTRTQAWADLLRVIHAWQDVTFPLRGRDVMATGIGHGPRIGQILKEIEAWWESEDYRPGREECLKRLREQAATASND